jgi:hypothetical protein
MKLRTLLLVSPLEPSGVTWLINCLLELGVRCGRKAPGGTWLRKGRAWTLNPVEEILEKWLPSVTKKKEFEFRPGLEVQWTHAWPQAWPASPKCVLWVRDPRDALFSRYRRENSPMSYREFLKWPDPFTLLPKADHWRLFHQAWLKREPRGVFRFEDYKRDAYATLSAVVETLGIDASKADQARAVEVSGFEKAAEAEKRYLERHPEDKILVNRSGKAQAWKVEQEDLGALKMVEAGAAGLLDRFQYEAGEKAGGEELEFPQLKALSFFKGCPLRAAGEATQLWRSRDAEVARFSQSLDPGGMMLAGLEDHEVKTMLKSVAEYLVGTVRPLNPLFEQWYDSGNPAPGYWLHLFGATGNPLYLARLSLRGVLRQLRARWKGRRM